MTAASEAAALVEDLARLKARPYAEVGVPMFLVPQDLRSGVLPGCSGDPDLADRLLAMAALAGEVAAVAPLVEVLADRHLLGKDGPVFTRLADARAPR